MEIGKLRVMENDGPRHKFMKPATREEIALPENFVDLLKLIPESEKNIKQLTNIAEKIFV